MGQWKGCVLVADAGQRVEEICQVVDQSVVGAALPALARMIVMEEQNLVALLDKGVLVAEPIVQRLQAAITSSLTYGQKVG
jgi:hypothetical protein